MRVFKMRGFTLIEILVVILIISIISGIAVATLSSNQKKDLALAANSMTHLMLLAEDNALLRPATLGLALTPSTFQFFIHQDNQDYPWIELKDQFYKVHHLPNHAQLSLTLESKQVPLNGKPQIIFSQNGDITPFKLYIGEKNRDPLYQITGLQNGEVSIDVLSQ